MIISDSDKYIHFLSKPYEGSTHDYGILKAEFPPEKDWFKNQEVQLDLGYQVFTKDYSCKKVIIPHKKPTNQDLSEEKKKANKSMSKKRIFVEHSIGGLKRYRILSDRLRIHDKELYNSVLVVCAGLWNFNLKY